MHLEQKHSYRLDDDTEEKKAKGTKKCIVKRELTFKFYMYCLFNDEVIIKSQQRFRSDHHRVYTEEVNKIALSSDDDKRTQTFDKVTTYPYRTNAFKICENEMRYLTLKKIILKLLMYVKEKSRNKCIIKKEFISKSKSQALRNKSQVLRNESQALRNKSQALRNELQALRNKTQKTFNNESQQTLNNKL